MNLTPKNSGYAKLILLLTLAVGFITFLHLKQVG